MIITLFMVPMMISDNIISFYHIIWHFITKIQTWASFRPIKIVCIFLRAPTEKFLSSFKLCNSIGLQPSLLHNFSFLN